MEIPDSNIYGSKTKYLMKMKGFVLGLVSLFANFITVAGQEGIFASDGHLKNTDLLSLGEVEQFRPQMLKEALSYFEQELKSSPELRETRWYRNYQSQEKYLKSISQNRERFKKIIGVVDERKDIDEITLIETSEQKALVAETGAFKIYSVKWPVMEGVTGEGLWIEPKGQVVAQIVALPDADQTPEMIAGLSPGVSPEARFAEKLASAGCRVLIPVLIDRNDTWSGIPGILRVTNETHREFIYRRSYEVGRHIIGYEVQKVLAAVDWFTRLNETNITDFPIAVAGYGEGGLLAFYSAAIDQRIKGTLVSGYFQKREEVWQEPVYRNVWGLLNEFGDAEIAGLVAPGHLIVEACKGPEVDGPPAPDRGHSNAAAPGRLITPPLQSVLEEAKRVKTIYEGLKVPENFQVVVNNNGNGFPGSTEALHLLLNSIGVKSPVTDSGEKLFDDRRTNFNPDERQNNQITELLHHLDKVIQYCREEREEFWNKADFSSTEQWMATTEQYREYFSKELLGEMSPPSEPLNPRTRLVSQTSKWRGYWVKLDVWPEMMTGGILLVPNDLKVGEKRPVVVCQHGLGGSPEPLVDPEIKSVYHSFGAQLADMGYVVYAPQHIYGLMPKQPYGKRDFRIIQRMANPLKQSLYSLVIAQEKQTMKWLHQLPFVDNENIALYGLSYGGKTAMRVPAVLKDYSVVICAGDFNQWVWKTTSLDFEQSYMYLPEYEMYEFDLGNTFNYAEMAGLIAPRPFMVERGHWDPVSTDEWVAYEYAKVRRLYDRLGIGDRTTIEYFNGPHEIHGVGTFQFLKKHLKLSNQN